MKSLPVSKVKIRIRVQLTWTELHLGFRGSTAQAPPDFSPVFEGYNGRAVGPLPVPAGEHNGLEERNHALYKRVFDNLVNSLVSSVFARSKFASKGVICETIQQSAAGTNMQTQFIISVFFLHYPNTIPTLFQHYPKNLSYPHNEQY